MVTTNLPNVYYTAAQVRELDRIAIDQLGGDGYKLMKQAAIAVINVVKLKFPKAKRLLCVAGSGNNGGDAFLSALIAQQAGYEVLLYSVKPPKFLKGDAASAYNDARAEGISCCPVIEFTGKEEVDLIIDGVLGTGISGDLQEPYLDIINKMNGHSADILAIDVPSGLSVDTGCTHQTAIKAAATVTFIGVKRGLVTGHGPDYAGQVWFDALGVGASVYSELDSKRFGLPVTEVNPSDILRVLRKRSPTDHKGKFGHLLVVGGNSGMLGAVLMAGIVGVRSGVGLATIATRTFHAPIVSGHKPELMAYGIETELDLEPLLQRSTAVVVGPGLGSDSWAEMVLAKVLQSGKPLIMDADALNLLASGKLSFSQNNLKSDDDHMDVNTNSLAPVRVITPHPGEAARLLGVSTADIQADRFKSAIELADLYQAVVVLKGAGTLISSPGHAEAHVKREAIRLNQTGNPGMATGGMGDVLAGLIGAFVAQGIDTLDAASLAVMVHGQAADSVVEQRGVIGLLATDLVEPIREILNGQLEFRKHVQVV